MPNPFDQSGGSQPQQEFQDKTPAEFLEELVGEGKKYATVEELARASAFAQNHIGKLESENASMKEQLTKASTVEDIMSKLQQQPAQDDNTGGDDQSQQPSQEPVDVDALIEAKLKQHSQDQSAQANQSTVLKAMTDQFGDKAGEVWDKTEAQLGVDLEQLAKSSPEAALRLLGATGGEQPSGASGSNLQSSVQRHEQQEQRPPEGSKRLVDYELAKGNITRQQAYKLKLQYSADPAKYNA